MCDQDIRARALIQTAAGKLNNVSEAIEYIAAEEIGIMQSKDICHGTVDVTGIRKSTYKRGEGFQNSIGVKNKCGYSFIASCSINPCCEDGSGFKNLASRLSRSVSVINLGLVYVKETASRGLR